MSKAKKPVASLSLDLDNEWCFMQTAGDAGWTDYPTYLPEIVPRILEFFAKHDIAITFFIVGRDAELDKNHAALRSIAESGHEIGNHSFGHQPWLQEYSAEELDEELATAEIAIRGATGITPRMFRGPGYSYTQEVLEALKRRGYDFDCSSFPNATAALGRLYLFRQKALKSGDQKQRSQLFGRNSEVFRPLKPYEWNLPGGRLLEIPVTTLPFLRVPIHFSYVLYLASFSESIGMAYFRFAMFVCAAVGVEPSMLFHPLDFMGSDDKRPSVQFFPGMKKTSKEKIRILDKCISVIKRRFEILPMGEHAARIRKREQISVLDF